MVERMISLIFTSLLWGQISTHPQNCDQISRSSSVYKYQPTNQPYQPINQPTYQPAKTILYQLPYHQNVASATTKQPQAVYDSHHANTFQQYPVIHSSSPSAIFSPEQNKEPLVEYQHSPALNNIHHQYQTIQQPDFRQSTPTFGLNQGYFNFLPVSSTPQNYITPQQNPFSFNPIPLRTESIQRPNVNPYYVNPIVSGDLQKQYRKLIQQPTNPAPQNYHIYSPQVKATPIVNSQVYHPAYPQLANVAKMIPSQNPPKLYTNFQPMVLPKSKPEVHENPEREEQKEEANEEDHENNEEEHDADDSNYKKENDFDENLYQSSKYTFPRFTVENNNEDDEKESYKLEDHEDQEDDKDDHEESVKSYVVAKPYSKLTSKHRGDKYILKPNVEHFKPSVEYKKPKMEVKMIRYTQSLNTPPKEYIEGKGSESVPVVQRSKQSFHENWYITKSTRE